MLVLTKDLGGNFKDVDLKQGIVSGYFAAFDTKDSDGDIIRKGAFSRTIAENGPQGSGRIKNLQDHDKFNVVGKLKMLQEDNYGLKYESQIGKHIKGRDYLQMIEDEIITEHSFGYKTVTERKEATGNILYELKMFEGSGLQVLAANSGTPILSVKSETDLLTLMDSLEKALRNGKYSDETFERDILPKYKSLQDYFTNRVVTEVKDKGESIPTDEEIKEAIKSSFKI